MLGILSLTIFSPLVGVAAILLLRLTGSPARQPAIDSAAKWIALVTTLATLTLSVLLVARFDPNAAPYPAEQIEAERRIYGVPAEGRSFVRDQEAIGPDGEPLTPQEQKDARYVKGISCPFCIGQPVQTSDNRSQLD